MTAIVDLVFTPPPRSRRLPALVVAVAVHAALLFAALGVRPTLEAWSADLAARIHDDLTRVEVVDIEAPPPPPADEPPPPPPEQLAEAPPPAPSQAPPAHAPRVRVKVHNPPAHAGKVIAAPGALDMTGDVIVQGFASGYAGGVTSGTGTGAAPGSPGQPPPPAPAPRTPPPAATRDLSTPVALPFDEWSCPWPAEALDLAIDEQTAIIKVTVGPDGRIESSRVEKDPGDGFGAAALECTRGARLIPARDRDGHPIRATATARLRFFR